MAEQIGPRGLPSPELCQHEPGEVCDMCDPKGRRDQRRQRRSAGLSRSAHRKEHPKPAVRLTGWSWEKLRQACFIRAGDRCERCGKATELQCHHRKLRAQGGRNTLSNLAALCFECHMWCHDHPEAAQLGGYIVPSWADPASRAMFLHDGRLAVPDDEGGYRWEGRT